MTLTIKSSGIRKTAICAVTTIALSLPGFAAAGWGDGFGSRIQAVKTKTSTLVSNVREKAPLQTIANEAKGTGAEVFESIKEMRVLEQLKQTMGMIKQMQAEYEYFSGGQDCAAVCASFRSDLKTTLNEFLDLAMNVPALNIHGDLLENLQRMTDLVDYVPPRALYLMWQTIGAKMEELQFAAQGIRQTLNSLPPLMDPSSFGPNVLGDIRNTTQSVTGEFCEWANDDKKPIYDLIQGRLELAGWAMEKSAGLIPDVSVKGEGGATAGVAVANGTASAAVGVKPTDGPKKALMLIALIPQTINWAIKLNILRAKVACR